ncbi:MAG: TIGR02217 family protein [Paracoccaceae bacterium]
MNFHEVRFPTALSFGSVGGPYRKTDVVTLANGYEQRNSPWAHSRRRYDAGLGMRSLDDIEELIAFFEARQGQLYGFRWKDWSDYRSVFSSQSQNYSDQSMAQGDGQRTEFQLTKTYRSGDYTYTRPILKPVVDTIRVGQGSAEGVAGTDFHIDATTGIIRFDQAPAAGTPLTAGFEFDVPVRFDTDQIRTSVASFQAGEIPDVPIVEVRV